MTLKRTALPPRTSEPKRYVAPKKRNRKRATARHAAAYGEKAEWLRLLACVVHRNCAGPVEAHHVKTRGAGGMSKDIVSLCQRHHREFHDVGRLTFVERHGVDLYEEARHLEVIWRSIQEQP